LTGNHGKKYIHLPYVAIHGAHWTWNHMQPVISVAAYVY